WAIQCGLDDDRATISVGCIRRQHSHDEVRTRWLGMLSTRIAARPSEPASKYIPASVLDVSSFSQPIAYELAKPARLPTEVIKAMPAAAANPPRKAVGSVQNNGNVLMMPIVAKQNAAIARISLLEASTLPTSPAPPTIA